MSYFTKVSDYQSYREKKEDFHWNYNANSGGGQQFLAGQFINEKGELLSPTILDGCFGVFNIMLKGESGKEIFIPLDDKGYYEIKPRGTGSSSMKLGIGSGTTKMENPNKLISSFFMLPSTCNIKSPKDLSISILTSNNYWLQSMWLKCNTTLISAKKVSLIPIDFIYCGGSKDKSGEDRFFKLDAQKRVFDIISLSKKSSSLPDDLSKYIKFFADIYLTKEKFNYDKCVDATKQIMELLAKNYPDQYSGIEDPLPFLMSLVAYQDNKSTVPNSPNQIYYGAPGTGKTRHLQKEIYDKFDDGARVFTTFHQSYSYEDFVEGLKPKLNSSGKDVEYHIEKGVFYEACEKAAKLAGYKDLKDCIADTKEDRVSKFNTAIDENKIMLICIDEINRGNVASIFGDLISLIEPSKRLGAGEYEMIVTLPYSKDKFGVPTNLLIVGTMNTADRSIQLLDSALRRRFEFVEMAPKLDAIADENAKKILQNINNRIRCLLNKDNQIGHSYLVNAKSNSDILKAIVYKIIPLLEEYFYNDIDKIRFVLNETDKVDNPFYKEDKDAAMAYQLYPEGIDEPKSFFKLDDGIKDILDEEDECAKYLEHLLK